MSGNASSEAHHKYTTSQCSHLKQVQRLIRNVYNIVVIKSAGSSQIFTTSVFSIKVAMPDRRHFSQIARLIESTYNNMVNSVHIISRSGSP